MLVLRRTGRYGCLDDYLVRKVLRLSFIYYMFGKKRCHPMFKRIFIAVGTVAVALTLVSVIQAADSAKIEFTGFKKNSEGYRPFVAGPVTILVNGIKVGEFKEGEEMTGTFAFEPENGGNTVQVIINHPTTWAASLKSDVKEFNAGPGDKIAFSGKRKGGFWDSENLYIEIESKTGQPHVEVVSTKLTDDVVEKELSSELVETLPGIKRIIKRSRTIEHGVFVTETNGLEGSLKAEMPLVSAEIKGKVEKALGETSKQSETVEQTIEVDGNALPKVKLTWVEKYRVGTATTMVNGVEKKLPFEFRENIELRMKRADN